ncbi:MAG: conjugal transfer protein TraX [Lachnospiraceae bacterium]|nr:conjugal transfer protein TraX [Lachnospiraceae bacterium]
MNREQSFLSGIYAKWDKAVAVIGISGLGLKIIACVIMLIDHAAMAVVQYYLNFHVGDLEFDAFRRLGNLYAGMRLVGRVAFPIFCFLLVEGFLHTKNFRKYALRLFLFGLISEPVFDLALFGQPVYMRYQNVYFTLLFGLLCIRLLQQIQERKLPYLEKAPAFVLVVLSLIALGGSMAAAWYCRTDYSFKGVLAIALMYQFRRSRILRIVLGEAPFYYEPAAFFSAIPISLYNGKRGSIKSEPVRYFFYVFYPLHLLVLYLISVGLGCR